MVEKNDVVTAFTLLRDNARHNHQLAMTDFYENAIQVVKTIPEAEGTWEKDDKFICSRCRGRNDVDSLYCPSCGARMTNCKSWKSWFEVDGKEICALIEVGK